MNVQILLTINECYFLDINFQTDAMIVDFDMNGNSQEINLPTIETNPVCDFDIELDQFELDASNIPLNITVTDLFEFNLRTTTLTIKTQSDAALVEQSISLTITITSSQTSQPFSITLQVNYYEDLLTSEGGDSVQVPDITCSESDLDWSFELPEFANIDED